MKTEEILAARVARLEAALDGLLGYFAEYEADYGHDEENPIPAFATARNALEGIDA